MTDEREPLPHWNSADLPALLTLTESAPLRYVSRFGEANRNGRSYGGQVLGQAIAAAGMSVDPERHASMLQFLFVQGTDPSRAVEFAVTKLQDGKRFSSRHVRGTQGDKVVCDATATFALPMDSPSHGIVAADDRSDPDRLQESAALRPDWAEALMKLSGYGLDHKACIDFRTTDAAAEVDPEQASGRLRFWIRVRQPLPKVPAVHAAALAFLSDWWLNYCSLGLHVKELGDRKLYVSSLNHGMWFHRPFAADEWLFVDARSPSAASGRGFSHASIHDRTGNLVATASQDCLMAFA